MTVKIFKGDKFIQDGVIIEGRTYSRSADLIRGLGFDFEWYGDSGGGKIIIYDKPLFPSPDMDLRLPSGGNAVMNAVMLDNYVKDTPLSGLGAAWIAAEEKWRINAVFLCALACHESDFGRSRLAREKKNLYGFMAYDSDPFNSAKSYARFEDSIEDVCALLVRHYLFPSGKYFSGAASPAGINVRYASDKGWAGKVVAHMAGIVEQ
jgi:hypothetical protein